MDPNLMDHRPVSGRHRFHRHRGGALGLLLVALTIVSLAATVSSLALFTDQKTVAGNAFTAGTIVLGVNPATALLTASALMPGDNINGTLVASNSGTGALRYAMSSSSTNADGKNLATQMTLTIKTVGSGCGAFDGTSIYSGSLASAAFGNSTPGADTGDRNLAAGTNETLCFRAGLPSSTGNAYQGATTTTTFTFDAEQTANN